MSPRALIAYLLIAMLVAGGAFALWHLVYNSEHNVRRRKRRARQARHEAALLESKRARTQGTGDGG